MLKHLLLLSLLLSYLSSYPQDEPPTEADRKADSILNEFFRNQNVNPESGDGIDSSRMEQAESKYMDNFLGMERDPKKELIHKRILQITIGVALLTVFLIGFRKRRRLNNRDRHPSRM